jgi:hypothetical protein
MTKSRCQFSRGPKLSRPAHQYRSRRSDPESFTKAPYDSHKNQHDLFIESAHVACSHIHRLKRTSLPNNGGKDCIPVSYARGGRKKPKLTSAKMIAIGIAHPPLRARNLLAAGVSQ